MMSNQAIIEWLLADEQQQLTIDLIEVTRQVTRADDFDGAVKFLATKLRMSFQRQWSNVDWDAVASQLLMQSRREPAA